MVEGRACTHSEFRLQASKVKRLESLSRPPCYNEVVSSLGRSAFLLSMSQIDAIDIGARGSPSARSILVHFFLPPRPCARAREAVELAVAKYNIEQHNRDAMRRALKEAEHGWQRAIDKIAERANTTKGPDTRR
jgi:hypothetical protein